jgi:hypothetical protein
MSGKLYADVFFYCGYGKTAFSASGRKKRKNNNRILLVSLNLLTCAFR